MTDRHAETSPRRAAIIAGIGYVAIFILAIFANFFVRLGLVAPGDAATTFANISESELLFRLGIIAFLVVFILDIVVAWALYILFRSVNSDLSLLTAWSRLVYTVFLGVALIFMFDVLRLVSEAGFLSVFEPAELQAQVMLSMDAFNNTWLIGLACFGFHLILLAYLLAASSSAPKLLAVIVGIAGAAYMLDTTANTLLTSYSEYENVFLAIVGIPSIVGELWLAFWLLLRGGKENTTGA
jgi:hypothetical protein